MKKNVRKVIIYYKWHLESDDIEDIKYIESYTIIFLKFRTKYFHHYLYCDNGKYNIYKKIISLKILISNYDTILLHNAIVVISAFYVITHVGINNIFKYQLECTFIGTHNHV